jgi:hypothetical protein
MFGLAKSISGVLLGAVVVVVGGFTVAFVDLLLTAFRVASSAGDLGGMPTAFTSYGYISIELVFLGLMLYGAFQVVTMGLGMKPDDDMSLD